MRLSFDEHLMEYIEADDTPVFGPSGMHELQIGTGQRASIIVNTSTGKAGDAFWIRASAALGQSCVTHGPGWVFCEFPSG